MTDAQTFSSVLLISHESAYLQWLEHTMRKPYEHKHTQSLCIVEYP